MNAGVTSGVKTLLLPATMGCSQTQAHYPVYKNAFRSCVSDRYEVQVSLFRLRSTPRNLIVTMQILPNLKHFWS
jgi:hypothetical protein